MLYTENAIDLFHCFILPYFLHEMVTWDYSVDMTDDSYIRNSDLFLSFTVTAPFP